MGAVVFDLGWLSSATLLWVVSRLLAQLIHKTSWPLDTHRSYALNNGLNESCGLMSDTSGETESENRGTAPCNTAELDQLRQKKKKKKKGPWLDGTWKSCKLSRKHRPWHWKPKWRSRNLFIQWPGSGKLWLPKNNVCVMFRRRNPQIKNVVWRTYIYMLL